MDGWMEGAIGQDLWLLNAKVEAVSAGLAAVGKVTRQVEVALAAVRARGFAILLIADGAQAARVALDVDDGHAQWRQLAAGDTVDNDVGAGVVVLVRGKGGPGPCEQALVRVGAAGHVLGDQDGPFVVDCER